MNLERGFLRATIVASLVVGIVAVCLSGRPSLEDFRWRRPTDAEKAKADDWWFTRERAREEPQEQPQTSSSPSNFGHSGFSDIDPGYDTTDPLVVAKLGLDDKETALRSIHFDNPVRKDYQAVLPLAFFLRYYSWPFALGLLATWTASAIIRRVGVGWWRSTDRQQKLLLFGAAVLISMLLFPPFIFSAGNGLTINQGYSWLFSPPNKGKGYVAHVDVPLLFTQEVVVGVAFFAMYLYLERRRNP